jgi:NADH:ubiquinone oxidoreductase subunit
MATIGTRLYTWFQGRYKGSDAYGNRYYEARRETSATGHKKRWVVYRGLAEPSKVPPTWHGWLHYTLAEPIEAAIQPQPAWLKEPLPNLTGTKLAYVPSGHVNRGGVHAPTVADYQAWKPQ